MKQQNTKTQQLALDWKLALIFAAGLMLCFPSSGWSKENWAKTNQKVIDSVGEGDYKDALKKGEENLKVAEEQYGNESAETSLALNNLALVHKRQGNYDEAIKLYERALNIAEKLVGPKHPDLVVTLNNLAAVYEAKGEKDKAEDLYKRIRETGHKEWAEDLQKASDEAK